MSSQINVINRIAGVNYALTNDGIEMPIVNILHPSFALDPSTSEVECLRAQYLHESESWLRKPRLLRRMLFGVALRKSRILQGLKDGDGSYLSGMNTYLMKLGPEHMDRSFALSFDAKVAKGIPSTNVRLRLRNMAHLIADELLPLLMNNPVRPVLLLNIGGGTAMDSLNALILIMRKSPGVLTGRKIRIQVFDGDARGAGFGARALDALMAPEAPLFGIDASLDYFPYNWSQPEMLAPFLEKTQETISCCSSEGALLEYGTDKEIYSHLDLMKRYTQSSFSFIASASLDLVHKDMRDEAPIQLNNRYYTRESIAELVVSSGWNIARILEAPTTQCFCIRKPKESLR